MRHNGIYIYCCVLNERGCMKIQIFVKDEAYRGILYAWNLFCSALAMGPAKKKTEFKCYFSTLSFIGIRL